MARESLQDRQARLAKIIAGLQRAYPDAHCELNFTNPLELLVATILSAQCTDKRVNLVTADLFRTYRAAADYAGAVTWTSLNSKPTRSTWGCNASTSNR